MVGEAPRRGGPLNFMAWQGIEGHDAVAERFRQALARGRLASTFLFVGPSGIGKRTFALKLAESLFCQASPVERLAPCGALRRVPANSRRLASRFAPGCEAGR